MKNITKKNIILLLLLSIMLMSCGKDKNIDIEKEDNNTTNIEIDKDNTTDSNNNQALQIELDSNGINVLPKGGKIGSDNKTIESPQIETTFIEGTLSIGDDVIIKEGKAKDFPVDFPIINGGKIYSNSNMKEYGFIIVNDKEILEIENYYIKELEQKGWIINKEDEQEEVNDSESKYLIFSKKIENNIYKEVIIDISSTIPKIIIDSFNVEGKFIEISFEEKVIDEVVIDEEI